MKASVVHSQSFSMNMERFNLNVLLLGLWGLSLVLKIHEFIRQTGFYTFEIRSTKYSSFFCVAFSSIKIHFIEMTSTPRKSQFPRDYKLINMRFWDWEIFNLPLMRKMKSMESFVEALNEGLEGEIWKTIKWKVKRIRNSNYKQDTSKYWKSSCAHFSTNKSLCIYLSERVHNYNLRWKIRNILKVCIFSIQLRLHLQHINWLKIVWEKRREREELPCVIFRVLGFTTKTEYTWIFIYFLPAEFWLFPWFHSNIHCFLCQM